MFKPGATVFLNLPANNKSGRSLHRASVVDFSSSGFTIAMDESGLRIEAGKPALLFFERRQAFMQQPVRVDAVFTDNGDELEGSESDNGGEWPGSNSAKCGKGSTQTSSAQQTTIRLIVGLQPTGEPISAEERASYRIITSIVGGVTATLEEKTECVVLDVSATGFSIIFQQPFQQGQVVRATLHYEGKSFNGTAIVQSIKPLPGGKARYGLHCAGDGVSNAQLRNGLQKISAEIQRQQLRRQSGKN